MTRYDRQKTKRIGDIVRVDSSNIEVLRAVGLMSCDFHGNPVGKIVSKGAKYNNHGFTCRNGSVSANELVFRVRSITQTGQNWRDIDWEWTVPEKILTVIGRPE